MYMYICIYTYRYRYVYIYIYIQTHTYICTYTYTSISRSIYILHLPLICRRSARISAASCSALPMVSSNGSSVPPSGIPACGLAPPGIVGAAREASVPERAAARRFAMPPRSAPVKKSGYIDIHTCIYTHTCKYVYITSSWTRPRAAWWRRAGGAPRPSAAWPRYGGRGTSRGGS